MIVGVVKMIQNENTHFACICREPHTQNRRGLQKMAALTGCELTIGTFYREDANYYTLQMFLFNFKWIGHVVVTFEPGGNLRWYF